ncbi:MAG TPA: hypothetical protein VEB42_10585, partial [Chitinophagaceae bacterium]|nr:hypothetical protein [Chitinophagaceae bacterium]
MKEEILTYLHDPRQLEKLYRANKLPFKRAFSMLYPEIKGTGLADFWNERLNYEADEVSIGTRSDLLFAIIASLVAGLIAKLPAILHIDEEFFYPRNIGFIIFPVLATYFAWKNKLAGSKIAFIAGAMLAGLIYINILPGSLENDTLVLSCIHLGVFLWFIFAFAFVGEARNDIDK